MEIIDIVRIILSAVAIICGIVIVSRIAPYLEPDNEDDDESTFIEIDGRRYKLVPAEDDYESTSEAQTEETTATNDKQFIEIDGQRYELVPAEE